MRMFMKALIAVIGLAVAVLALATAWVQFNKEVVKPVVTVVVIATPTEATPQVVQQVVIVVTATPPPVQVTQPSVVGNSMVATQETQCQWLQNNFPQSSQEAKARFGLPDDTTINFIYELCPSTANAFGFKAKTDIQLQVPSGGCIDSWAGFTKYIGDVGTPVPDGWGGWRVYKGTVRAPEMTYRIKGCK
jgi:hypothetical protein